jgi:hypothetical protein
MNMTATTVEQVFTEKATTPEANGRIFGFVPPPSFAWLKHFSAEDIAEFFFELLDALNRSQYAGNWSAVTEVIEAWKATANIKADSTVTDEVEQGLAELAVGQGKNWEELRGELGL